MAEKHSSFNTPRAKKILAIGLCSASAFVALSLSSLYVKNQFVYKKIETKVEEMIADTDYEKFNEEYIKSEMELLTEKYINRQISKEELADRIENFQEYDKVEYLKKNLSESEFQVYEDYKESLEGKKNLANAGIATGILGAVGSIITTQILTMEKKKENVLEK